ASGHYRTASTLHHAIVDFVTRQRRRSSRGAASTIPAQGDPMSNVFKCFAICIVCVVAQPAARGDGPPPAVLHKHEGELRARRPREGVASPSTAFLLKISPNTNGSKHLLVFSEELPTAAVIAWHKRL